MTTKSSKKSFADAFTQTNVVDFIRHATTDEELAIMKKRVEDDKKKGANIYNMMVDRFPMVLYLIKENRLKSIKILADLGLNMHAVDNNNNNALHYCASDITPPEYISFFIQQGVDVHHRNHMGCQPLALASGSVSAYNPVSDARISNIKSLMEAGANVNDRNPVEGYYKGRMALSSIISLHPGMLKVLDFLMRQPEVEIHDVNGEGDSALHLAAARGSLEMTQYLINTGRFDLDQVNGQGLTALDVAKRTKRNGVSHGNSHGAKKVIAYLRPIYAALAEQKELEAITSLTANRGVSGVASVHATMRVGMANREGLSDVGQEGQSGHPKPLESSKGPKGYDPSKAADSSSPTSRPSAKLKSL